MKALKRTSSRRQRNYNGNPLAFFRANFDLYGGMKRAALSKFDPGMYRALGRAGQLEEAIPEANELSVELGRKLGKGELALSSRDIETIIKAYKPSKGNAAEASRHLPYNGSTIWRYWRNEGLKAQGRGDLSESEVKKVIEAHKTYDGNASEAAKSLPYSPSAIRKYWRKTGLKIQKKGRPKKH